MSKSMHESVNRLTVQRASRRHWLGDIKGAGQYGQAEVAFLDRANRRRLPLLALVVAVLCSACTSGEVTLVPRTTDQKVQAAIANLADERLDVRRAASEALCRLEQQTAATGPALVEVLRHAENADLRSEIAGVLGRIGSKEVVAPALMETLLGDPDPGVRGHAAVVLGSMGTEKGVVPALVQAMVDEPHMRWAVTEGLARIGPPAAQAVPALIQALEDGCASEIEAACEVERNGIVRALRAITGQDFGEDVLAWREWWDEPG
jgi:HEAT repeat protein